MSVKKARKLKNILLIAGLIVFLIGYYGNVFGFIYFGVVLMFSALVPHFLWNKCPHCGKHFGRDGGDYCQHCGKPIE